MQVTILVWGNVTLSTGQWMKAAKTDVTTAAGGYASASEKSQHSHKKKNKIKLLPWLHETMQWKFIKGFHLEESVSIPWLQKARKRPKDAQEAGKTIEDKDKGGCRGSRAMVKRSKQEMKCVCQRCKVAGKNKRWRIWWLPWQKGKA